MPAHADHMQTRPHTHAGTGSTPRMVSVCGWTAGPPAGTYRLRVTVEGGQVQGSAAILVRLVYLGSFLNQELDHCSVTFQTSPA